MQSAQQPSSDMDLVIRARSGDHSAFAQIYERYAPAIYRYIYHRVHEAELAEDLQADVFLRAFENLEQYEDRGWPFSAWLYRIARDRTIDQSRRSRVRQYVPLDELTSYADGPEALIDAKVERAELNRLLAKLTHEQRQVITLRFLADLPIQEVALRIGRSEGAVKALQHRGIQSLARMLEALSA
jgi:RNA polymerase sigma-70 factor (ECF subfamily)